MAAADLPRYGAPLMPTPIGPSAYWQQWGPVLRQLAEQGLTDKEIHETGKIPDSTISKITTARRRLGIPGGVEFRDNHIAALANRNLTIGAVAKPFEIDPLPEDIPTADEILERRRKQFERTARAKLARRLIPVRVKVSGPFGVAHFGDPHVDDDGTNIELLEKHVAIVNRTPGLFAGNVGDFTNNWIGRLARLYGEQATSAREAWVLAEWLLRACDWLYLVGGNHDAWSGAGDPLKWIARQQGSLLEPHGSRLGLQLPDKREVRINARHDFKGHSMWNDAHGPAKAAQMGWRDHILCCGHMHTAGHQWLKDPASGLVTHAFRVASYKAFDRYAEEKGLPDKNIWVCPVTIIDPQYPDDDPRFIQFVPDPEEGAEYLTWKRSKAGL